MTPPPFLQTKRVLLRSLTEADCDGAYLNWLNDPEVCRHNGHHLFPYRPEDAVRYVKKMLASPNDLVLAVTLTDGGRHIGNISLQNIDWVNRLAEFAILIGEKDCWGKGYSKEAARLLLDHGFRSLNLHRIHCGTSASNMPMRGLAAHLGMREEGRRRQALFKQNSYLDLLEYGLLREEFLKRFPPGPE
ncbi:MAG: GNAT family N-acetyltransferase [Candidatus Omnitrophica bacterium]|nr:GNAT family N-acetyltransferase [Candidatus Omnitrophota bacterium]